MPAILITTHDTEHRREVPLDAPNERSGLIAPDLSLVGQREPGVRNEGENQDQGSFAERPPQVPAEHASQSVQPGENTQETVPGGSKGERRFSRCLLICAKICQSREETGRTGPAG
jgi:hypothetical protein